ncbi:hypothetical protein Aperf_G00000045830 [Anoplocephala perfoliata]
MNYVIGHWTVNRRSFEIALVGEMAQKMLTPVKRLPQQIQNLPFITKLPGLASVYGILWQQDALAYDQDLCLLAVSYSHGHIAVNRGSATADPRRYRSVPIAVTSTSENTQSESTERPEEAEIEKKPTVEPEVAAEAARDGDPESVAKSPPSKQQSPLKKSKVIRAQATKFRTFSRTIRSKIDHEEKYAPPPLPVPPSPRVIRIMPYTQALCCATWRITPSILAAERAENTSSEVLIAYDDGAYLTWIVPKLESEVDEPVIAVNQEVASVPYGPLPCAPIQRIVARPSVSGGVNTAFVGGLPRAQHAEKHTTSVVGGVEEHVCFQFGSGLCDFVILPSKPQCKSEERCPAEKESNTPFPGLNFWLALLAPHRLHLMKYLHTWKNEPSLLNPKHSIFWSGQIKPLVFIGTEEPVDGERIEVKEVKHPVEASKSTEAGYLPVLTEREFVAIDLTQPSWPVIPSPYLKHLDCTGITTVAHISYCIIRLGESLRQSVTNDLIVNCVHEERSPSLATAELWQYVLPVGL